jgi:hypothetical protein
LEIEEIQPESQRGHGTDTVRRTAASIVVGPEGLSALATDTAPNIAPVSAWKAVLAAPPSLRHVNQARPTHVNQARPTYEARITAIGDGLRLIMICR